MNKKLLLLCCSLLIMSGILALDTKEPSNEYPTAYLSAVRISETECNQLTALFAAKNTKNTLGGCFHKKDLQEFLHTMPKASRFVNFRFCIAPAFLKTSLMLCGAQKKSHPASEIKCIRNGGSEDAFCPSACDLTRMIAPKAISIYYFDYLELSDTYQVENPKATLGGNIDKAALQAIINSLPPDQTNIVFRFCLDPQFNQMSVIFIGGTHNQSGNSPLILRNGVSAESFCPGNCSRE